VDGYSSSASIGRGFPPFSVMKLSSEKDSSLLLPQKIRENTDYKPLKNL